MWKGDGSRLLRQTLGGKDYIKLPVGETGDRETVIKVKRVGSVRCGKCGRRTRGGCLCLMRLRCCLPERRLKSEEGMGRKMFRLCR